MLRNLSSFSCAATGLLPTHIAAAEPPNSGSLLLLLGPFVLSFTHCPSCSCPVAAAQPPPGSPRFQVSQGHFALDALISICHWCLIACLHHPACSLTRGRLSFLMASVSLSSGRSVYPLLTPPLRAAPLCRHFPGVPGRVFVSLGVALLFLSLFPLRFLLPSQFFI